MAWRGVHISRDSHLRFADNQLVVGQTDDEVRLAIEDIAWIVIDAPHVMLSSALIRACMNGGVAIIFTDEFHTPNGIALPFHRHFRQGEIARLQSELAQPVKKRLWQAIVMAKIANQAAALDNCGREGSSTLTAAAGRVRSGDPVNVEARAARYYFGRMFRRHGADGGKIGYARDDGNDLRNKMLNYGYAIVRSGVARALTAYGFVPSLGLMHASQTNAFNLADDLVEPFRPFVDVVVHKMTAGRADLTADPSLEERRALAGLLQGDCRIGAARTTLLVATEQTAESLVRAMEGKSPALLLLPSL
ncbi:type II CRISPR-associated endonuclease Cas1 [Dongia sp.]|uniref:type II CRISPR-associated endonuclease Cas1 n=1 Tax=Dongia sp. TaxID=1977262 RepID=UPI0034A3DFD9